jgi:hypothetical protein
MSGIEGEADFKSNFVTANIDKPMAELEELNNLVKKKKAEVRKAMFYAKHPDLLMAKREYDNKMASVNVEKFNEAIAVSSKEEPKPKAKEPEPVKVPEVKVAEPVKVPLPQVPLPQKPVPQHSKAFVVGMGQKWF